VDAQPRPPLRLHRETRGAHALVDRMVTITDSSPDSITEIPQALIGVVGLFGV
jgi:hypothetical protein